MNDSNPAADVLRKWNFGLGLLLVVLPLAVFAPAMNFPFVSWDDDVNILNNAHVQGLSWENLCWMFTDVRLAHRYLPLGWMSYAVERTVWGHNPLAFHTGNLVLHILNTLLVFGLLKRVCARAAGTPGTASVRELAAAFGGAALWSLHPLRAEVVSWCSSRIYLMATLWFLLSLHAYLRAADTPERRQRWVWLSVALFTASLFTYPVVLLGAGVFVLLDWLLLQRLDRRISAWVRPEFRRVWLEKIPFFAASGLCLWITLATRTVGLERSYIDTLQYFGVSQRVMQGFFGWTYYLWKPWWPMDLAPKYGNLIDVRPFEARFVTSALVVVVCTLLSLRFARRYPAVLGLWAAHLFLFLPLIGLTEYPHSLYDRYSYGPGILLGTALALVLWKLWPKPAWRNALGLAGAGAAVSLAWLSSQQTLIWQNTASVRLQAAQGIGNDPSRAEHEERAGQFFLEHQRFQEARVCFEMALEHDPSNFDTRILLGDALAGLDLKKEALAEYEAVVQSKPTDLTTRHNVGVALCKLGRLAEGAAVFRGILEEDPSHENAKHNLRLAVDGQASRPPEGAPKPDTAKP